MTAREHAEELRQQAIRELLTERDAIDAELKTLGYGQEGKTAPARRRGRPPKSAQTPSEDGQQVQHQVERRAEPELGLRSD
jgi:hypothetical protein